ncbi:MAG: glucose PTS transporter subunit EIIB [Lachnospiraceae bacterium]
MDCRQSALEVLEYAGGRQNIESVTHCATRLRLVIIDNTKCDKDALEKIQGVKGVFQAAGQLQIILGAGVVDKVYDAFIEESGVPTDEVVEHGRPGKQNLLMRVIHRIRK